MKQEYLEVAFKEGRPLAAYYHFARREGDTSVRCEEAEGGLVVDYAADGRPIGIEITAPSRLVPSQFNELLTRLGHAPLAPEELAPLTAA
ncbi:MAG: DUF2283 domain-containing protein [Planctomycetota bacterium]